LRKNRTRFYFLAERCGTPQGPCGTLRYGLFYATSFVNGKILALRCVTGCWKLGFRQEYRRPKRTLSTCNQPPAAAAARISISSLSGWIEYTAVH